MPSYRILLDKLFSVFRSSKLDIFIHDILLNFAAVLGLTRTVGNYKLTLKFRAKIKEQFVIHDITEKKKNNNNFYSADLNSGKIRLIIKQGNTVSLFTFTLI